MFKNIKYIAVLSSILFIESYNPCNFRNKRLIIIKIKECFCLDR